MPAIPPQLQKYYPVFLEQTSRDLHLNAEEHAAVAAADPEVWAYWAISTLSGNERTVHVRREGTIGRLSELALSLFTRKVNDEGDSWYDFDGGELTRRMDTMYSGANPSMRQRFERLSRTLGVWTYRVDSAIGSVTDKWRQFMPVAPQVSVMPDPQGALAVEFHGHPQNRFFVDGPASTVVNLGPGLTGADFAIRLMGAAQNVHLVSGGKSAHFLNGLIGAKMKSAGIGLERARSAGILQASLPTGTDIARTVMPEVHTYSDGIAAELGRLSIQGTTADIVVMGAVHSAGIQECIAGVAGAKDLLRPGGLLVIKAPDVSVGNDAGMDQVVPAATSLFGNPAADGECGWFVERPGVHGRRPASYAIFRQQS